MALETAQYINQLVPSNPAGSDLVATGKNHLQLIKQVLLNCFPNLAGPVTLAANDFNGFTPVGGIIMWSGAVAAIPVNWHLCDGTTLTASNGSRLVLPDLRDKFIIGGGNSYSPGAIGGSSSATPTINVDGHALSQAELPYIQPQVNDPSHTHGITDPSHSHPYTVSNPYGGVSGGSYPGSVYEAGTNTGAATTGITINGATTGITIQPFGGNQQHSHTAEASAISILPPFYALAFICRV